MQQNLKGRLLFCFVLFQYKFQWILCYFGFSWGFFWFFFKFPHSLNVGLFIWLSGFLIDTLINLRGDFGSNSLFLAVRWGTLGGSYWEARFTSAQLKIDSKVDFKPEEWWNKQERNIQWRKDGKLEGQTLWREPCYTGAAPPSNSFQAGGWRFVMRPSHCIQRSRGCFVIPLDLLNLSRMGP